MQDLFRILFFMDGPARLQELVQLVDVSFRVVQVRLLLKDVILHPFEMNLASHDIGHGQAGQDPEGQQEETYGHAQLRGEMGIDDG